MIASFLAAALIVAAPVQVHVEAADASTVTSCYTVQGKRALVTTVKWSTGETSRYKDMKVSTAPFPGTRTRMVNDLTRTGNRIKSCIVKPDGVYARTKGGDLYRYTVQAPITETPVTSTPQVQPERPAREARWTQPITLSVAADVEADWKVADMAAAWESGITVTDQPCGDQFACVPVTTGNLANLNAWGVAYQQWGSYMGGENFMTGCQIVLDPIVPSFSRPEIAAHEIGHCLGLPHWQTTEPLTVMSNLVRSKLPTASDLEWVH